MAKMQKSDAAAKPTMGLDDGLEQVDAANRESQPEAAASDQPQPQRGRLGVDEDKPYCALHNVQMRAYGSKPDATHFRCPVPNCGERAKRIRPALKVPTQPQICPQRSCHQVALEVVPKLTTLAQLHMQCPSCGFALKVPRPGFAPQLEKQRRLAAAEDLAAR